MGRASGRHPGWVLVWLLVLGSLLSACSLIADGGAADHTHEPGTGDDHAHDDEGKVDHHGNPIYDEEERVYEQVIADAVSVEFTVENFIGVGGRGGELAPRLVEGEHANLQFRVTDPVGGGSLAGLSPSVWVDVAGGELDCRTRVEGYRSGALDRRPLIDLNSYFILALNRDNTISVLDPMVDVAGMTNLFSVILLQGNPGDWAMEPGGSRLFVTLPDLDKVAVVDLHSFLVEDHVGLPGRPGRITMEPGGRRAWVTLARDGGVVAIDTGTLAARTIPGPPATTAVAFSPDATRAVMGVSHAVIARDSTTGDELYRTPLAGTPAEVAVGPTGDAYVAQPDAGLISILAADDGRERARITADPGVSRVGISPDGRWGVAVSPTAEQAYVIEAAADRMTHRIPVRGTPDLVTFTGSTAYVHTSGSPSVTLIPLAEINPGGQVSVLTVPVGDRPSGASGAPVTAGAITPIPDGTAVLVPNPVDDVVYFYTEGSQSALGGFQGHTLQPRAVQVVDRSLREPSPGVYTGSIRIPQGSQFIVAFQLASPALTHCFSFAARPSDRPLGDSAGHLRLEVVNADATPRAGEDVVIRVRLTDADDRPMTGVPDLTTLAVATSVGWKERFAATPAGDGEYEVRLRFPAAGLYQLLFSVPSLGIGYGDVPSRSIRVVAG